MKTPEEYAKGIVCRLMACVSITARMTDDVAHPDGLTDAIADAIRTAEKRGTDAERSRCAAIARAVGDEFKQHAAAIIRPSMVAMAREIERQIRGTP